MREPLWEEVKARAEQIAAGARRTIEAAGVSHEDTQFHRGQLHAALAILALASPAPPPKRDDDTGQRKPLY